MKKIGLRLPFIFLFIYAIVFHPTMRIHLLEFARPWLYMILSPQMFFLLATILIMGIQGIPRKQLGITTQPLQKNITLGLVWGVAGYILLGAANILAGFMGKRAPNEGLFEWSTWLLFSYFILAPITEELFFRGVIFHALKESYSNTIAIFASAILFAASHSSMMVGPFILGVIAAYFTQKTKSIFPGMIFHALSNGLPWFFANHCPNLQFLDNWIFFRF